MMIKQFIKTVAAVSLLAFASQVSADTIKGSWDPADNSADFSWRVNSDGVLVVTVTNTSNYHSALIAGLQFDLDEGGQIDGLVSVDGTTSNSNWSHTTDARGCVRTDCMVTSGNFWGLTDVGIVPGATARFRFFGDFGDVSRVNDVVLSFLWTRRSGRGQGVDGAWGCQARGCGPSEVPEPGTLIMFGAGLVGFGVVARRRRKADTRA